MHTNFKSVWDEEKEDEENCIHNFVKFWYVFFISVSERNMNKFDSFIRAIHNVQIDLQLCNVCSFCQIIHTILTYFCFK